MAIRTSGSLLQRDVSKESSRLGAQAAKLAKAKSGGAGIGGLLGAIAGVALAPFTGGASLLMAGIGGGLGALAGSKIGGAAAGGQESILEGGKFLQGSRGQMAEQIANQEGMDIAMAIGSGMFQAGNIRAGLDTFGKGFAAAGKAGKGFLGQVGQGGFDVVSSMAKSKFADLNSLVTPSKEGAGDVVKSVASEGIGESIGGITDKVSQYSNMIPGLLGSQDGVSYEMDSSASDQDFATQHIQNMSQNTGMNLDSGEWEQIEPGLWYNNSTQETKRTPNYGG